jgi:hypothetical protein
MGENFVWAQSSLNAAKRESSNRWCQLDPTAKQTNRETEKKEKTISILWLRVVAWWWWGRQHGPSTKPNNNLVLSLSLLLFHTTTTTATTLSSSSLSFRFACLLSELGHPPREREREKGK